MGMTYDFDHVIERRGTDSVKWQKYGSDVLPLWVADMDFVACEPVIEALHRRVDQKVLGYSAPPPELRPVIADRLMRLYQWAVDEEEIVFVPGVVTGLSLAFMACTEPGEAVLAQPPVYFHFIDDPVLRGRVLNDPPLVERGDSYEIDFDAFEQAITPSTRIFLLCNPHNPVGRVFTRTELERLGDICLRHDIIICSDEIHCDLIYPGYRHMPIASMGGEIAQKTITLMAPSKTYNLAGLGCAFAIVKNPQLRRKWNEWARGLIPGVNVLGYAAALAAYRDGQEWLDQLLAYLDGNRHFLADYVARTMPSIQLSKLEATYLGWLDCRKTGIPGNPHEFFLNRAKVALNDGSEFGTGGEGFVRINFGCPRQTLQEALDLMADALKSL
jgi:cysteine-S-conjugate beta-lyase